MVDVGVLNRRTANRAVMSAFTGAVFPRDNISMTTAAGADRVLSGVFEIDNQIRRGPTALSCRSRTFAVGAE